MQFSTKTLALERLRTELLILPVAAGQTLSASGKQLDALTAKSLSTALKAGDLPPKAGSTLLLRISHPVTRVLLVSLGEQAEASAKEFQAAADAGLRTCLALQVGQASSLLHEASVKGQALGTKLRTQVLAAAQATYRFDQLKSKKESPIKLAALELPVQANELKLAQSTIKAASALVEGMALTKDLANLPGNICTPTYLADAARALGRSHKLKVQVLDTKQMETLGMGALLAVAKGSAQAPKFIIAQWLGGPAKQAPVVLVGKGITFDTGGISLKPAPEMDEMKYDMCGAASVLGTLRAVATMKLPINVVGLIPTCENMPSGTATRPGDVVTSMSGQTIEILNTDAEGRLILCDALTYAERFKPAAVIDIATLTGACVIALGHHHSALFTNDETLASDLQTASRESLDTVWRMPMDEEYQEGLKSPFADMANIGGRAGGAITAACFLARYTKAYSWAHLDIAGTAWKSGAAKGATARPVALLTQYLSARAAKA